MLRVFTEKLIDSRNSVILHRSEVLSNLIPSDRRRQHECGREEAGSRHEDGASAIKSWVCTVGQRAVEKASEKVDRAKETIRSHVAESSKTQFAGNLFSKLVISDESSPATTTTKSSSYSEFKKEFVNIKKNLKVQQTCLIM